MSRIFIDTQELQGLGQSLHADAAELVDVTGGLTRVIATSAGEVRNPSLAAALIGTTTRIGALAGRIRIDAEIVNRESGFTDGGGAGWGPWSPGRAGAGSKISGGWLLRKGLLFGSAGLEGLKRWKFTDYKTGERELLGFRWAKKSLRYKAGEAAKYRKYLSSRNFGRVRTTFNRVGLAVDIYDAAKEFGGDYKKEGYGRAGGEAVGAVVGAQIGSKIGASLGTALIPIPVVGTAVGYIAGTYAGKFAGSHAGKAIGGAVSDAGTSVGRGIVKSVSVVKKLKFW